MRAFIYILFLMASIAASASANTNNKTFVSSDVNIQKLLRGPSAQQKTEQCDKMSRGPDFKMTGRTSTAKPHQYSDRSVNK